MFVRHHWPFPTLPAALAAWQATLLCAPATRHMYLQHLTSLLADADLARLRAQDLPPLAAHILTRWSGRGTRNAARTALRAFLVWACAQGAGQRSLTPDAIIAALPMEPRSPAATRVSAVPALPLAALHTLLPTLPLRTRALAALQLACGRAPVVLVALCLGDVTLAERGLILHLPTGDRELVGPAISEARAYVKLRLKASGGDLAAPLFEGCAGRAISPNYARRLLRQVAYAAGITGTLAAAVRQQGGGLGSW